MSTKIKRILNGSIFLSSAFYILCAFVFGWYVHTLAHPQVSALSAQEETMYRTTVDKQFPRAPLSKLFWDKKEAGIDEDTTLSVYALSVLAADMHTGSILYEKNADQSIPPASMTKLVAMYIAFEEAAAGTISLDDTVPLPKESWAVNAPPSSSLMFLNQGQTVSVRELLLGLAVSSGNDAAIALADYICGSQKAFVQRMNDEVKKLGLKHTVFVDASGYSEQNTTTAREFASFVRTYLERYPESIPNFHSVKEFAYPKEHNIIGLSKEANPTIVQKNTNPALGTVKGVNGLKTGYIPESGYNLTLTAERDNTAMFAVMLGGPGQGTAQGNSYRLKDAQNLSDYVFSNFKTFDAYKSSRSSNDKDGKSNNSGHCSSEFALPIAALKGTKNALYAKEAFPGVMTVPASGKRVERILKINPFVYAPVATGQRIGYAQYNVDGLTVQIIPLIADRDIKKAFLPKRLLDRLAAALLISLRLA